MKLTILIALLFFVTAGQTVGQTNSVDNKALSNELEEINERFEDGYAKHPIRISSSDSNSSLGEVVEIERTINLVDFSGCKLLFVQDVRTISKEGKVTRSQQRIFFSLKDLDLERTQLTFNEGVFGFMVTTKGRNVGFEQLTDGPSLVTGRDRQTESRNFMKTTAISFKSKAQPEAVHRDLGRAIEICGIL